MFQLQNDYFLNFSWKKNMLEIQIEGKKEIRKIALK